MSERARELHADALGRLEPEFSGGVGGGDFHTLHGHAHRAQRPVGAHVAVTPHGERARPHAALFCHHGVAYAGARFKDLDTELLTEYSQLPVMVRPEHVLSGHEMIDDEIGLLRVHPELETRLAENVDRLRPLGVARHDVVELGDHQIARPGLASRVRGEDFLRHRLAHRVLLGESLTQSHLKGFRETRLFQNSVGRMAGFDFIIDRKMLRGNGAVPDFMITLTLPLETAAFFAQELFSILWCSSPRIRQIGLLARTR